jgi:hypothetical protein
MDPDFRHDPRTLRPGDEADVLTTTDGIPVWAPPVVPAALVPLVAIDENGYPGLVFDDDGAIVYTED